MRSPSGKVSAPIGTTMNSCASTLLRRVRAAVEDVHHRHRHHPRHRPAEVAIERQAAVRAPPPAPPRATPPGSRWRRACSCWACRRRPSSRRRSRSGRPPPSPRAAGPMHLVHVADRLAHALAAVALRRRRRAAPPPRARRWTRRSARRRGRCAPLDRTTSASTVGLPRLSRISRACTSMMVDMNGSYPASGRPVNARRGAPSRHARRRSAGSRSS